MQHHRFITVLLIVFCIAGYVYAEDFSITQTSLNLVERIARIEEGQKAIVNEMRARFKAVDERFEMLEKSIDKRFESIDKRFDSLETRFESIDKRFESIDKRFESLETRFESIDKRFDSLEKRFESLEKNWEKRFESLTREINQRFVNVDKRIDLLVNQNESQTNMLLAMFTAIIGLIAATIGLIAYVVWDRKTVLNKSLSETRKYVDHFFLEKAGMPEPIPEKKTEPSIENACNNTKTADQLIKEGYTIPNVMQEKIQDVFNFLKQFPEMQTVLRAA
jgi:DNA repair exonuclease SbcCD ATPase subunit